MRIDITDRCQTKIELYDSDLNAIVLDNITIDDIIDLFDKDSILDQIGEEYCKMYFGQKAGI